MTQLRNTLLHKGAAAIALAGLVLLAGCATVPEPIRGGPQQSPQPATVRAAPEQFKDMTVRWGGIIVAVDNGPAESEVEVVSRPLYSDARPVDRDETGGRFLVRITGFIDPVDYAPGREFTVVGVLEGVEQRDIGTHSYVYPVVRATGYYLWPLRYPPAPDAYYYGPYYDPWYPYWSPYSYPYLYPYYYPYSYPYTYPYPQHRPPSQSQPRPQPLPRSQPMPRTQPQPRPQPMPRPSPMR